MYALIVYWILFINEITWKCFLNAHYNGIHIVNQIVRRYFVILLILYKGSGEVELILWRMNQAAPGKNTFSNPSPNTVLAVFSIFMKASRSSREGEQRD